jgi:Tol biopolymer transport system component
MLALFSPLRAGINLMKRGKLLDAAEFFESYVDANPSRARAYVELGKCRYKLGDWVSAVAAFHDALEREPSEEIIRSILEVTNWRQLSDSNHFANWPSFSPDGKHLAYVSARKDTNNCGKIGIGDRGGIYVINIATGEEEYLISDEYYNTQPIFSPDGQVLVFLSSRRPPAQGGPINQTCSSSLYQVDLKTFQETELLNDSWLPKHLRFSADGKKIIFSGWAPGEKNSGVYSIDMATRQLDVLVSGAYESTAPTLSVDGKYLAFSAWRVDSNRSNTVDIHDNSAIIMKDLRSNEEVVISPERFNSSFPTFSPDGTAILFLSVRRSSRFISIFEKTDNPGIYLYDRISRREKCIVTDETFNKFPSFTPDGKQVVFIRSWSGKSTPGKEYFEYKGVYRVDIASRKISQVVSEKNYGCRHPVVSPDGKQVAYLSWHQNSNRVLYLANLEGLPTAEQLHVWIDKNLGVASV